MTYEYRTHGDFPCKRMDLEAMGTYPDIVLKLNSDETKIKHGKTWIEIGIFAPNISEAEAIRQISKALKCSSNQLLLF